MILLGRSRYCLSWRLQVCFCFVRSPTRSGPSLLGWSSAAWLGRLCSLLQSMTLATLPSYSKFRMESGLEWTRWFTKRALLRRFCRHCDFLTVLIDAQNQFDPQSMLDGLPVVQLLHVQPCWRLLSVSDVEIR